MVKLSHRKQADVGAALKTVAMTLISTVGGAAGPLYGTLFLQLGSTLAGHTEVELPDYAAAWRKAVDGVQARGKAVPGDKTMVDALVPAVEALEDATELNAGLGAAATAAEHGMHATTPLVARKGRASYLGERSAGHQDPGATSSYYLLRTAAGSVLPRTKTLRKMVVERSGMARYAAALDQGTTSSRAMVFDHSGRVVSISQQEHRQIYPRPGWVEHDPMEIWARCSEVLDDALTSAGLSRGEIAALGITNQRETTVVWDRNTGEPVHNAIVWQDTRTDRIIEGTRPPGPRRPGPFPGKGRAAARDLLLGPEGPLDPRPRRRRPRPSPGRRAAVRHHRQLADLEPDRRRRVRAARDRRDQRQPDADARLQGAVLGPRDR